GDDHLVARLVDLRDRPGNLEIENPRRGGEPLAVLAHLEDGAGIDPLALEHAARVMQPVAQHVQLRIAPRDEMAIEPDGAVTVVEGNERHVWRLPFAVPVPSFAARGGHARSATPCLR